MSHKHEHHHSAEHWIKTAFILNLWFSILEVIWWFFTNSISILSDAVHDFWDSLSIAIAYICEKISKKWSNDTYSYGYKRYSVVWALITILILLIWAFFILKNAIIRIWEPQEVKSLWMIILAILWIIINWAAVFHTSQWEKVNEKAINLHLLEDVLWRVAVLVWSILMYFFQRYIIDSILSICICIFIIYQSRVLLKETLDIFLEKVPEWISCENISNALKKIEWIEDIHHIHIWTLDWENNYSTLHCVIDKNFWKKEIINLKNEIKKLLKQNKISHSVIEFERSDNICKDQICS